MVPVVSVTVMMTMPVMAAMSARTDRFLAVLQFVHQHGNKDHAAYNADDQLNGNLIGNDDRSCKDIADQNEQRTKQSRIKQCAPDLIALEQGYEVGYDQADIGDLTHDHDDGCRDDRGNGKTKNQNQVIVDTQVLGEILSHSNDVKVVGI